MSDWDAKIIAEFRENQGSVGGSFAGASLLLLHSIGAKSGQERVHPLMYLPVEEGYAVFASKAGAPTNPAWYHNLLTHPETTIEIGTGTKKVRAREASGSERERIWSRQKQEQPAFAEYERKTSRKIPVMVLEPSD